MTDAIGQTIYQQLGAGRFRCMTGAKHFLAFADSLSFCISGNTTFKRINHVRVELTPADTYTVTFSRLRKFKLTTVAVLTDVYAEDLEKRFTETTGLVTSLGFGGPRLTNPSRSV